jgi:chemotaxis protein MotB
MSAGGRRRRGGGGGDHHGADERWLLTYADMITLLMCLFMVLWSISSVNISKLQELQRSLQQAFIGKVLDGGKSVLEGQPTSVQGVQENTPDQSSATTPQQIVSINQPISQASEAAANRAARKEQESLMRVQREVQSYARAHGFDAEISTTIDQRGLVIRLLTDKVLFDSGYATIKPSGYPLIDNVGRLIARSQLTNPIRVEGNTDDVPISSAEFANNWELSAARATAVLERFLNDGIRPARLSMAGYADQNPIAPNTTEAGRAHNRRVDVVILRHNPPPQGGTS